MRKLGWTLVLLALLVVGGTVLLVNGPGGGRRSSGADAAPLPPVTSVSATTEPVAQEDGTRPARVRIEVYGQPATADVRYELSKDQEVTRDDTALPWVIEASVGEEDEVQVSADSYLPRSSRTSAPSATAGSTDAPGDVLLCRIIVNGVVVESEQRPGYVSCRASLADIS